MAKAELPKTRAPRKKVETPNAEIQAKPKRKPYTKRKPQGVKIQIGTIAVFFITILVITLTTRTCSDTRENEITERDDSIPIFTQIGEASYYSHEFAGRPTASTEIFQPTGLTAAHLTISLGAIIRVTNLENGEKIKVKVNDRGPFSPKRILDLSDEAARRLKFRNAGTAQVKIEMYRIDNVTPKVRKKTKN